MGEPDHAAGSFRYGTRRSSRRSGPCRPGSPFGPFRRRPSVLPARRGRTTASADQPAPRPRTVPCAPRRRPRPPARGLSRPVEPGRRWRAGDRRQPLDQLGPRTRSPACRPNTPARRRSERRRGRSPSPPRRATRRVGQSVQGGQRERVSHRIGVQQRPRQLRERRDVIGPVPPDLHLPRTAARRRKHHHDRPSLGPMTDSPTVALLGTGIMGAAMARHILAPACRCGCGTAPPRRRVRSADEGAESPENPGRRGPRRRRRRHDARRRQARRATS